MIIHKHIIALCIYCCYLKKFEDLSIFLAFNNWLSLLKEIEKKFFAPDKVIELCQKVGKEELAEVTRCLLICKYEFEVNCTNMQAIRCQRKHMLN